MAGWVKIHRKLTDNPIFQKPELLQLFLYCILRANHEPVKMIWNGKETTVDRGQFITGREAMGKELCQNPRTTYDRLNILKNLDFINIKSNNRFSLVTVANYGLYQQHDEISNSESNNKPTTNQQLANTNKNDKNYKNDKKDPSYGMEIIPTYQQLTGDNNIPRQQKLLEYLDNGMDKDLIIDCIRDGIYGEQPTKYIFGILDKCVTEKITTLQQYVERKKQHQKRQEDLKQKQQQGKKQHENFDQRSYEDKEFEKYYYNPMEG